MTDKELKKNLVQIATDFNELEQRQASIEEKFEEIREMVLAMCEVVLGVEEVPDGRKTDKRSH